MNEPTPLYYKHLEMICGEVCRQRGIQIKFKTHKGRIVDRQYPRGIIEEVVDAIKRWDGEDSDFLNRELKIKSPNPIP